MKLEQFAELAKLDDLSELAKVERIIFFLSRGLNLHECAIQDIVIALEVLHFARPNISRMKKSILASRRFVKASSPNNARLHAATIKELRVLFPQLSSESEDVLVEGLLIPKSVYSEVPSYIKKLADQVNASYEHRIYDGCAVLMRRLLEILLIRTYEKMGVQQRVQNSDNTYKMLEGIVADARNNPTLGLSRNTRDKLDDYRALGNFAAHKIEFSTRRGDIERVQLEFRATVEELLLKSELKK